MVSIDFHTPELRDKSWVNSTLAGIDFLGCEYCFGNMFIWSEVYKTQIGKYNDFLVMKTGSGAGMSYSFPVGRGNLKDAILFLLDDSAMSGVPLRFSNVTDNCAMIIEELFPGCFKFEARRDYADYIYNVRELIELSGRKYHQKRNHISAFKKKYDWSFEKINSSNISECDDMYKNWLKGKSSDDDENYSEFSAVKKSFENYDSLDFFGGIIKSDGKVVAFTIGERLNAKAFCTHIEKADIEYDGAYSMINREFSANCLSDFEIVNREEDMGIEGLRKSKLSYRPCILLQKNIASYKG